MSYGRRPRDISVNLDTYATTSTSASLRRGPTTSNQRQNAYSAPPASAYFSPTNGDNDAVPKPTPDAPAHFAYSSTLRRNPEEHILSPHSAHYHMANAEGAAAGIWSKLTGVLGGQSSREAAAGTNGYSSIPKQSQEVTASARFASLSAEVCFAVCYITSWILC
jgi:P-type Ca2+ transporter type 2C